VNANLKHRTTPVEQADLLRDAMRHVAGTVSVITAGGAGDRTGLTATSAVSLALDPPTMIVSVNRGASAWPVILRHRHFCINVLSADHSHVADRFAGRNGVKGADRYTGADWTTLATGAAALADAVSVIDCELEEAIERHSHAILVGAVRAVMVRGGEGLLYRHGGYGSFNPIARAPQ
jgi:flavin reductase (DIM6/NTAB) family NADH-FMN oxidoreductase RutF